jgi:hypothetical protein
MTRQRIHATKSSVWHSRSQDYFVESWGGEEKNIVLILTARQDQLGKTTVRY